MADNPDTQTQDNVQTQDTQTQQTQQTQTTQDQGTFAWKAKLPGDMAKSPTLQKFEDTPEGLGKAFESHLNLEKLLGHEKVPLPKGPEDKDGWARFNKALGVPEKPEGYGLVDISVPENMKALAFDKKQFAEIVHSLNLTPAQAKGLWSTYTKLNIDAYGKALTTHQETMTKAVNALRQEWGDAYDANVDLGQTVINKFAGDQETADFLTASLSSDPRGVKFLAKIGSQFAENKIGEFAVKRYAFSPQEAKAEVDRIRGDLKGPYYSENETIRNAAIDQVNQLTAIINKAKG